MLHSEDSLIAVLSTPRARRAGLAGLLLLAGAAPAREGHRCHHPAPPEATATRSTGGMSAELAGAAATPAEQPFLAESDAAMARMVDAMAVRPSGDIDCDFVAMMTAHHQGAIDMAVTLLRQGGNEQLRRLAQEIIVNQQGEIAAMQVAIGAPLPSPAPTQVSPTSAAVHPQEACP